MSPVRVLQVVTRLAVRGVPRHVLELATGLNPERFTVEVLAGRSEPDEGELWTEAEERGLKTWFVPALQRAVNPVADAKAHAMISHRIRQGQYDIVHTHISKAGILGRLAARRQDVPVVVHTYHGRVQEMQGRSLKSRLFRACEQGAARWSDLLIAVSQATVQQCLDSGIGRPDQYRVIYNGIDLPHFLDYQRGTRPIAGPAGFPVIGTIGSLTAEKGIDVLLRAMPGLLGRHPRLQLCVIGDGPLRSQLQEIARELGIGEQAHFPGIVTDVRTWLAHLDVLVAPSLREGLPTVLLEGMALERPVVASRVGGVPEIVDDGVSGLLVPAGAPDELGQAIDLMLRDEGKRLEMGRAGRERVVERFGLEEMLRQTESAYDQLLAMGKSTR